MEGPAMDFLKFAPNFKPMFAKLTPELVRNLTALLGEEVVGTHPEHLAEHGHDETEDLVFLPEVVVTPRSTEEVSTLMCWANQERIPVTPRAAGTGLSGGALPVLGGIVLSMVKMNRILEIDERNLQATVEPGVINQVFHLACKEKGLYYPPDPSSWGSSMLGGNLALNAGGPRAVKYGVTNAYVLNLEVVLANGEVIWTGANVLKNSTGYNLTQLMVGSEGTLGVITKAVFRLIPYPQGNMLMMVPFAAPEKACEAVSALFQAGVTPSACEFMERDAIDWTLRIVEDARVPVGPEVQAHLLIEVDGNHPEAMMADCEVIDRVVREHGALDVLFADTDAEKEALWKLRRRVGEAVKKHSVYKEEDTVVPRAELAKLLRGVKEIGARYGFQSVCYGHAGDGNLHVNIVKGHMSDADWNGKLTEGIREIFHLTKSLGGTISGEHGIGWVQKGYLDIAFSPAEMALQRAIKQVFDPHGILNPGKVFPD
jgi:glycolate oxidase